MGFNKAKFDKLYENACNATANDTRLVQLKDDMLKLLLESGEAFVKYVQPKCVVPHPQNRCGSKMQWVKIYTKGSKIIAVGVSLVECGPEKAVGFSINPMDKSAALSHIKRCSTSEHYASYTDPDVVEVASVGCGHWAQFLACIVDKCVVPAMFVDKLCENGRNQLDGDRLCRDQPALQVLLSQGIQFTVIKHTIEAKYPKLPNILQKALNVEHHIGEGRVQLCMYASPC